MNLKVRNKPILQFIHSVQTVDSGVKYILLFIGCTIF